jgi:hypothetical protein
MWHSLSINLSLKHSIGWRFNSSPRHFQPRRGTPKWQSGWGVKIETIAADLSSSSVSGRGLILYSGDCGFIPRSLLLPYPPRLVAIACRGSLSKTPEIKSKDQIKRKSRALEWRQPRSPIAIGYCDGGPFFNTLYRNNDILTSLF